MNKESQYQKYRETILSYGKTRVECECGQTLNRNSLSKHRKTQKHKDKVGDGGADPNSIEWFLEGYGSSESDEEEEPPKCVDCDNIASINEYYPNGDYEEKYWTLCKECFKKDQEESEEEEEEEEIILTKGTFKKDIVFHCSGCFESIIRDSKKHNECQIIKNVWVCGDCYLSI